MANYTASIILYVDEFTADDYDNAQSIIDDYVDLLAETAGKLTWSSVDFQIEENN